MEKNILKKISNIFEIFMKMLKMSMKISMKILKFRKFQEQKYFSQKICCPELSEVRLVIFRGVYIFNLPNIQLNRLPRAIGCPTGCFSDVFMTPDLS